MEKVDIRKFKNDLRIRFKKIRSDMNSQEKAAKDKKIFDYLVSLKEFKHSKNILTFVSTKIEVDTIELIKYALSENKRVVVPKCFSDLNMAFYCIKDLDDLEKGMFSVLEPNPDLCEKVSNFEDSLCVTPGLAFDMYGYRLGYGKGYYDRFFSNYIGTTVGVCYASCIKNFLPHGRYDKKINLLVTDKFVKRF